MRFFSLLLLLTGLLACKESTTDEPQPLPFLGIQNVSGLEGDVEGTLTFEVRLSPAAENPVTFRYETTPGTAIPGEDYVAISPTPFSIPVGQPSAFIEVTILGDTIREPDETFGIKLSEVSGARITNNEAIATIRNDDQFFPGGSDAGYTTPLSYPGYTLVWQDEFDGSALDPNDWNYEMGDGCPNLCGWGNSELQYYTDRTENHYVEDGKLVIVARNESFGGKNYTSSRITTQNKQSFQYGRVDIRAKLPIGQGMWPALWMLGDNIGTVSWPACGEIDIMEIVGHEPATLHGTVHWDDDGQYANFGRSTTLASGTFQDKYHVFSIIWDSEKIVWYLDAVQYNSINITPASLSEFRQPFFFIFNVAVGGNWPGNPDATTLFPQQMEVDYIRVFQED
jgi:beta-glucanase (GH16 family)